MTSRIHHPACPARELAPAPLSHLDELWAGARCICPPAPRRRMTQLAELVSFAAMLGFMTGLPVYLLWRFTA